MNAQPVISYRSSGREMNQGVASQSSCMMVPSRRPYCRTADKSFWSLWMDSRILMKHKERACMLSKCPRHTVEFCFPFLARHPYLIECSSLTKTGSSMTLLSLSGIGFHHWTCATQHKATSTPLQDQLRVSDGLADKSCTMICYQRARPSPGNCRPQQLEHV